MFKVTNNCGLPVSGTHLVLHPELDEGRGHEDRGPAEAGDAVDANTGVRVGLELLVDEVQPLLHDLLGRSRPVRKAQLGHFDFLLLELLRVVEFVSGADEMGDLVLLEQADVVVHGAVLENIFLQTTHRIMSDIMELRVIFQNIVFIKVIIRENFLLLLFLTNSSCIL